MPPQEWLGPRATPPPDWRGSQPGSYGGVPPGPGYMEHPPQRPPGPFASMAPMTRGPVPPAQYSWMPPHHGGPMQRPPYAPRGPGDVTDMWGMRPPSGPQSSPYGPPGTDHWSSRAHGQGREPEKAPAPAALVDADHRGVAADNGSVPPPSLASLTDASAPGASSVGVEDGGEDDAPPPARTAADRFRNVRIVQSAVSADMLAHLRKIGVPLEQRNGPKAFTSAAPDEVGIAEDAAASRECARLGLDGSAQRRLPMPGPLRLPLCTVELQQVGLWERFRQRCGTPMPPEPPPVQCEVRKSRGGGQVVVPHIPPIGTGPAAVAVNG